MSRVHEDLHKFLNNQRLEPEQIRALMIATDTSEYASASIVAVPAGPKARGRIHVDHGSVTITTRPAAGSLPNTRPGGARNG